MTATNHHRIDRARPGTAERSWKLGRVGRPAQQDFTHRLLVIGTVLATGYLSIRILQGLL